MKLVQKLTIKCKFHRLTGTSSQPLRGSAPGPAGGLTSTRPLYWAVPLYNRVGAYVSTWELVCTKIVCVWAINRRTEYVCSKSQLIIKS